MESMNNWPSWDKLPDRGWLLCTCCSCHYAKISGRPKIGLPLRPFVGEHRRPILLGFGAKWKSTITWYKYVEPCSSKCTKQNTHTCSFCSLLKAIECHRYLEFLRISPCFSACFSMKIAAGHRAASTDGSSGVLSNSLGCVRSFGAAWEALGCGPPAAPAVERVVHEWFMSGSWVGWWIGQWMA